MNGSNPWIKTIIHQFQKFFDNGGIGDLPRNARLNPSLYVSREKNVLERKNLIFFGKFERRN